MTYNELKKKHQDEVDAFPLGFAFSNEQFNEMMNKWGLDPNKDLDKIYSIGAGGFVQKKDSDDLYEMFERHSQELKEFKRNLKELEKAFEYEMYNHEYVYDNYEGDYRVLNCFYDVKWLGDGANYEDYFNELGLDDDVRKAYCKARNRYLKKAREWA